MTLFSILLLVLLASLVLAVAAGARQLRRQAVAMEAVAEASGTLADAELARAEASALAVIHASQLPEGYPVTEEDTKPDLPRPLLAPCSRCGLMMSLCHCKRES